MKIIRDIDQGSEDWHQLRIGKVTGSRFADVMAKGKGNSPSKTRLSYMYQLAAEIVTGQPQETYSNQYMEWGNECEPQARAMYELDTGFEVEQVAFVELNDYVGVSPDGLIDHNGMTEIKCPKTTTQIERYLKGEFPTTYRAQVQGQLWVAEREWCDFVSFDPRIDGDAAYFKVRVERDDEYIKQLELGIERFIDELIEMVNKLKGE